MFRYQLETRLNSIKKSVETTSLPANSILVNEAKELIKDIEELLFVADCSEYVVMEIGYSEPWISDCVSEDQAWDLCEQAALDYPDRSFYVMCLQKDILSTKINEVLRARNPLDI